LLYVVLVVSRFINVKIKKCRGADKIRKKENKREKKKRRKRKEKEEEKRELEEDERGGMWDYLGGPHDNGPFWGAVVVVGDAVVGFLRREVRGWGIQGGFGFAWRRGHPGPS